MVLLGSRRGLQLSGVDWPDFVQILSGCALFRGPKMDLACFSYCCFGLHFPPTFGKGLFQFRSELWLDSVSPPVFRNTVFAHGLIVVCLKCRLPVIRTSQLGVTFF